LQKVVLSSSNTPNATSSPMNVTASSNRINTKFLFGGLLIASAIIYLIISATRSNIQYYLTIEELLANPAAYVDRDVRISGVVIGESIEYDSDALQLRFTVANVPADPAKIEEQGGMAAILQQAVDDPQVPRLAVVYNGVRPDLMQNEAHAVMSGRLNADGTFSANELLLKCPSKYEAAEASLSSK